MPLQPKLFYEVPSSNPTAMVPPGPNSPVGRVWMALSRKHDGTHGTSSPETIGYAQSHGCVRLTHWDALQLSDLVEPGTPIEFR
ncbi:MAG: L,D-transpeptidase [Gemmatimonadaceae bacterium]